MTSVRRVNTEAVDVSNLHVGVVAASWNPTITDALLDGAVSYLEGAGIGVVTVARAPGSLELPVIVDHLIAAAGCHGVVALGAVVKGDTDHYTIVVNEATRGLTLIAAKHGVPVGNGLLAVHDIEHAVDRSGPGPTNKGHEAAAAVVDTLRTIAALRG